MVNVVRENKNKDGDFKWRGDIPKLMPVSGMSSEDGYAKREKEDV